MLTVFEANEPIRAPEFQVSEWVETAPIFLSEQKGNVVLLDFWDYSCINCLNSLPVVQQLHRHYQDFGLVVIGIHTPEFSFAHSNLLVKDAKQTLGITYPIALDNKRKTWEAYANRAWPTQYIIDTNGYLKAYNRGEGNYHALERVIRNTLSQRSGDIAEGIKIHPWITTEEQTISAANCPRLTPELYFGCKRGRLGNPSNTTSFEFPKDKRRDIAYLQGDWTQSDEYIASLSESAHTPEINVAYQARRVYAVMSAPQPIRIWIAQDNHIMGWQMIHKPDCYPLHTNPTVEQHTLSIWSDAPDWQVYTLLFQS